MSIKPSSGSQTDKILVKDLYLFNPKERTAILANIIKIEKRAFPSSEAFDFESELRKKNTSIILAVKNTSPTEPIGYLVYLRIRRLTLLHKICVVEQEREHGVGKCLIHSLRLLLEKGGSEKIHLWVDEARKPARALYNSCGFQQIDRCVDYYGPGRTGLKMQLFVQE